MFWLHEKTDAIKDFFKGNLSLSMAFWGYGILGAILLNIFIGLPIVISVSLYANDQAIGFFLLSLIKFVFWVVLSIGVWRCGRNSDDIWRWISRGIYVGLFGFIWIGIILAIILPSL